MALADYEKLGVFYLGREVGSGAPFLYDSKHLTTHAVVIGMTDYKGLSNAGTWLIGRLQTERDKARVLDGLEGASARQGHDRGEMDKILSALDKRQFYVHDVHAAGPTVIESRWSLSYLRGPLTRDEIKRLSKSVPVAVTQVMKAPPPPPGAGGARPVIPPDVMEVFFPTTQPSPVYRPMLVGAARVQFEDAKTKLDFTREVMFVTPVVDGPVPVRWEDAKWAGTIDVRALAKDPAPGGRFADVPPPLMDAKCYAKWSKDLAAWLARTQGIARLKSTATKPMTFSQPGEDERAFRARLALTTREGRDDKTAAVREKYGAKIAALEDKIRRAQQAVAREQDQASEQRTQSAFDIGGGLLGAVLGRGARGAIAGASRAARSANRASKQQKDVAREKENLDALLAKHLELQREANAALAKTAGALDPATMPLETVVTKPKKTAIAVHLVALAWKEG